MREIVFLVEEALEGGFSARAANSSIFTQADDFDGLIHNAREAVAAHFDDFGEPIRIRFQFVRVRTSSLLYYLATIYAWLLEISVIVLHLFSNQKLDPIGHAALLITTFLLTAFAWQRRDDFHRLRTSMGRLPLTGSQVVAVVIFLFGLIGLLAWIGIRLLGA
jgi:hypothetical protein